MAKLKLLSTIFSKLGSLTKNNGQIIVSRDSKSLYVDLDDERIEITDWIDINTEENLLAILTPLTNKYYYTKDSNKIWRYVNNDWECLNTSVNDLTPTYTESSNLVKLSSGEKLSVAFGKISKAITDLISHISDSVKHITSAERSNWNAAKTHADSTHAPADAQKNVQSDWSATSGDAYIKNKPTEFPPSIHTHTKSEISDFPSSLPASGGNADTVNNHTVKSNVPTDAVFTDTIYDDTKVKESIEELSSKLVFDLFGEKLFQYDDNNSISISILPRKNVPIKDAVSNLDRNLDEIAQATNSISENLNSKTNELNSNLDTLSYGESHGGKNLFDKSNVKIGKCIDNSNGDEWNWDESCASDYIYIKNCASISISGTKITSYGAFYDENKDYISGFAYAGNSTFNVDSNVAYVRVGVPIVNINSFQLEVGSSATPYEPYIPSVKMLAEEVSSQNESLSVIGKYKNLLNPTLATTTKNGVTCTDNGDGTYTFNGTVATGNYEQFNLLSNKISAGTYKLVGNPDYSLGCSLYFSGHGGEEIDYGNGGIVNFASDITTTDLYIYIPSGITLTNVVFKPMITENLNATYDDYVLYTGDGETLTEDVAELKNDLYKSVNYITVDIFTAIKQFDETATSGIPIQFVVKTQTFVYLVNGFKNGIFSSYLAHSYESGAIYHVRCYNGVWSYNQLVYTS